MVATSVAGPVDSVALFHAALAKRIGISPGVVFSATANYRNFIRLNCGLPWNAKMDKAMEKLGRMISPA